MKKLLIILPLLFSCKTSKKANYDTCGVSYVERDTVVITTEHIHYNGKCYESSTTITCVVDTFCVPKQR